MSELLILCYEFFKAGLLAIGGGMAIIPFLMQMGEKHPSWFTLSMLMDMIAISESTPGPIGVNMATYVGFTISGIIGGILSTLSLVLPSYITVTIIAGTLKKYRNNLYVDASFKALRPCVTGLIAAAGYKILPVALSLESGIRPLSLLLLVSLLAALHIPKAKKIHPIFYIVLFAALGVLLKL